MDNGVYENRINSTLSHLGIDFSFKHISDKTKTCLIIHNNDYIAFENISYFFEESYSLNVTEFANLEKEVNLDNNNRKKEISISKLFSLPYKSEFFDLVIYNGIPILELEQIESFFHEIKRILKKTGCFCVTVKNKSILKNFNRKFYENNRNFYANSYDEYLKIFKQVGFKVKGNWIIGSLERPYFIGNANDETSFNWLLSNFNKFFPQNPKSKNLISLIRNFRFIFGKKLFEIVSPYFLFYCYKESLPNQLQDLIEKKTGLENMIQQIRYKKIIFILFDKYGKPAKRLLCKRNKIFPEKDIVMCESPPKPNTFEHDLVLVDWSDGKAANFNDLRELELVLRWLINFQSSTRNNGFEKHVIDDEIKLIQNKLDENQLIKSLRSEKWLEDYEKLFDGDKVKLTGVHGDFSPHNILIKIDESKVNVIDWETYCSNGSPFYDMAKVVYHVLTPNSSVDEFRKNVKNIKNVEGLRIIEKILLENFQKKINLIIILRYYFLKDLACNDNVDKKYFVTLLDELSGFD